MFSSLFYNKVLYFWNSFPFDVFIKLANIQTDSYAAFFILIFVPKYRKLHLFLKIPLCQK